MNRNDERFVFIQSVKNGDKDHLAKSPKMIVAHSVVRKEACTSRQNLNVPVAITNHYISLKDRVILKQLLLEEKQRILENRNQLMNIIQDESTHLSDFYDRATLEGEFSLELKACDQESRLLKTITSALSKLEQGIYGYCDNCGSEIGLSRLKVRPTTTLCIDCKSREEIKIGVGSSIRHTPPHDPE